MENGAYVVRRKVARHDGTRYYNDKGPPGSTPDEGAAFDSPESAEDARQKLREPHLWEVLTQAEAEERDAADRRAASRDRLDPVTASVLAFAAMAGARLPRRRRWSW